MYFPSYAARAFPPVLLFIGILFLGSAHAAHAARNAGLIDGVWFSSDRPIENTQVMLYAAVLNQTTAPVQGTVAFLVDNVVASTTTFSVAADSIARVSVPDSFTAGQHAVAANIQVVSDGSVLEYYSLPPRPIFVDPTPAPVVVPTSTTTSAPTSYNTVPGNSTTNVFESIFGDGSTGTTTISNSVKTSGGALGSISRTVSSATNPFTSSLTTSRNAILGTKTSSSTPVQSSLFDVVTPTKNLFDVSVDIAGKSSHGLSWIDAAWAFILSLLAWAVYCIVPLILLGIIFYFLKRTGGRKRNRGYAR